jgi:hypothetical protein
MWMPQPRRYATDEVALFDAVANWYGRGAITIEEAARLLDSAHPRTAG